MTLYSFEFSGKINTDFTQRQVQDLFTNIFKDLNMQVMASDVKEIKDDTQKQK